MNLRCSCICSTLYVLYKLQQINQGKTPPPELELVLKLIFYILCCRFWPLFGNTVQYSIRQGGGGKKKPEDKVVLTPLRNRKPGWIMNVKAETKSARLKYHEIGIDSCTIFIYCLCSVI